VIYLVPSIYIQVIQQVSCGAVHVVALSEDGLLQAWGNVQPLVPTNNFYLEFIRKRGGQKILNCKFLMYRQNLYISLMSNPKLQFSFDVIGLNILLLEITICGYLNS
jgi:alpha-tubulin suppressor-like RCC1 family protein